MPRTPRKKLTPEELSALPKAPRKKPPRDKMVERAELVRPELGDDLDGRLYKVKEGAGSFEDKPNGGLKYKPEYCSIARILCKGGATDAELAEAFGVGTTAIWRWKVRYPAFGEATKEGGAIADNRVKQSLYRKAVGYEYREEVLTTYQGQVKRNEVIKHVQPDTKAAFLWLCNRDPANWKMRQEITGKDGAPLVPTDNVSKIELARILAFHLQRGQDESRKLITIEGTPVNGT